MKIKNLLYSLIEFFIINIPGGLGQRVRYFYYSRSDSEGEANQDEARES